MQINLHIGLVLFFGLIVLSILLRSRTASLENKAKELRVNKIISIAKQWIHSSTYDLDPIVALMHASGGMAYLSSARSLMTDSEIDLATSESIKSLLATTETNISSAIKRIRSSRASLERRY
jgi:hypothetical protein